MTMKKTLSYLLMLLGASLASCNLFIDEEVEDLSQGLDLNKKTVYTGDGFSNPKTEVGDDYTITYQYYDNVKLLTDEIQSYIVRWEVDDLFGSIGYIDFREDTPEQFLPRIGEVVATGATEMMPDGFYAMVMAAGFDEGVYRIGTCAVDMNKVFKHLECEADVTLVDDEMRDAINQNGGGGTKRLKDVGTGIFELEEAQIKTKDDLENEEIEKDDGKYLCITIPIKAVLEGQMPKYKNGGKKKRTRGAVVDSKGNVTKWSVSSTDENARMQSSVSTASGLEILPEETTMRHRIRLGFANEESSISPIFQIIDTICTKGTAHILGGIECSKSKEKKKALPKVISLRMGPLRLKVLLGSGVSLDANVFGTSDVVFNDSSVIQTRIRLLPPSPLDIFDYVKSKLDIEQWAKEEALEVDEKGCRHISGNMYVKNGSIEGTLGISASLSLGVGFGTKKNSVNAYVKNTMSGEASSFGITSNNTLSISDAPGMAIKSKTETGLKMSLTLNIYELLLGVQDNAIDISKLGVSAYKKLVNKLKGANSSEEDFPTDKSQLEKLIQSWEELYEEQEKEIDESWGFLDFDLPEVKFKAWDRSLGTDSWVPQMKDFSYKRTETTSQGVTYYTTWSYSTKGKLVNNGFGPYYPCIYVDGGKGNPANGTYYPDLDGYDETDPIGKNTTIKGYGTGIYIRKLQPGKAYTVYPALSLGRGREPLFLDVPQTLTVASPTVKIVSVDQYASYQSEKMKASNYYGYLVEVRVAVKGAASVLQWSITFGIPKSDGSMLMYEKMFKGSEVKETSGHPVRIDITYHKPSFESTVYGEYWVKELKDNNEYQNTWMEMEPYPFIGSWSAFNFSRPVTPMGNGDAQLGARFDANLTDGGTDPIVYFDDDDTPTKPVAIIRNGIRTPLPH